MRTVLTGAIAWLMLGVATPAIAQSQPDPVLSHDRLDDLENHLGLIGLIGLVGLFGLRRRDKRD